MKTAIDCILLFKLQKLSSLADSEIERYKDTPIYTLLRQRRGMARKLQEIDIDSDLFFDGVDAVNCINSAIRNALLIEDTQL